MSTLGLYHDDPLWLRSEIFYNKSLYYKRISFCFGLSDIEEPLAGIYKLVSGILYILSPLECLSLSLWSIVLPRYKSADRIVPLAVNETCQCYLKSPTYCYHFQNRPFQPRATMCEIL